MKKVLYIAPSPPNHLNRIRSLNILKALQGQAEVHLVCLCQDSKDYEYLEKHRGLYRNATTFHQPNWRSYLRSLAGILRGASLRVSFCNNPDMRRFLSRLDSSEYDIIYITPIRMAQYARFFPPEKVWVDPTDSMSLYYDRIKKIDVSLYEKTVALYEGKFFRDAEKKILENYRTIYCSRVDLEYAHTLIPSIKHESLMIPNVVDLNDFPLFPRPIHSETFNLCYWGMLKAPFNYTAVEILITDIFPRLREKSPHFRLEIIGPNPPKKLLDKCSEYITFTGYVPDLIAKLSEKDLFVCPLIFGTGVKNKMLQSLACGLPVLTTSIGAEGIDGLEQLASKQQLIIEDRFDRYPDLIIELSHRTRTTDYQEMRDFVEQNYSIAALHRILAKKILGEETG